MLAWGPLIFCSEFVDNEEMNSVTCNAANLD